MSVTFKAFKKLRADNSGAVAVQVALGLFLFMGFAAMGIDMAMLRYDQARLQNSADAAALAAVIDIPENTGTLTADEKSDVVALATDYAARNMAVSKFATVLKPEDVELGHWDSAQRKFFDESNLPEDAAFNAVRVVTRRSEANNNSVNTMFAEIFGIGGNVTTEAIAIVGSGANNNCVTSGIVALGVVLGQSTNTFANGWCIHGERGVSLQSTNCFEIGSASGPGATISMPDPSAGIYNGGYHFSGDNEVVPIEQCNNGTIENNDLPNIVTQQSIADFVNVGAFPFDLSKSPGSSDHVQAVDTLINNLNPNGFPIGLPITSSSDDIDIKSDISNRIFISDKKISVDSHVKLENVYLLAKENVEVGSNVTLGADDFCATGVGRVFIAASKLAKFGSNLTLTGAQIIAGEEVDFGSDARRLTSVSILSGGDMKFGSQWIVEGCDSDDGAQNFVNFGGQGQFYRLVS